jgi:hypothetical protein
MDFVKNILTIKSDFSHVTFLGQAHQINVTGNIFPTIYRREK